VTKSDDYNDLDYLKEQVDAGALRPFVAATFPLAELGAAYEMSKTHRYVYQYTTGRKLRKLSLAFLARYLSNLEDDRLTKTGSGRMRDFKLRNERGPGSAGRLARLPSL
jgi:hypothetical protein